MLVWQWPETMLAAAGPALSLVLLGLLVFDRAPRRLAAAAPVLAGILAAVPRAAVARPSRSSPRGRAAGDHRPRARTPGQSTRTPSEERRSRRARSAPSSGAGLAELWPLLASAAGTGYAFDEDPDGAYADEDRAIRKALDDMPWPERAAELRIAGVTGIVTDETLGEPYREVRVLNAARGGAPLLPRPTPCRRCASPPASLSSPHLDAVLAVHRSADFDPATDVVLEAGSAGEPARAWRCRPRSCGRLGIAWRRASTHPPPASSCGPGRSSRPGGRRWTARPRELVRADGHLVGVRVPAGAHDVEVGWSARPVVGDRPCRPWPGHGRLAAPLAALRVDYGETAGILARTSRRRSSGTLEQQVAIADVPFRPKFSRNQRYRSGSYTPTRSFAATRTRPACGSRGATTRSISGCSARKRSMSRERSSQSRFESARNRHAFDSRADQLVEVRHRSAA